MKKLLALVLALVMTLGLATVGANAALSDFKDADDVNYAEAVAVMNAIGVFVGDDNSNFRPDEQLKRSEAAKVVAYLLLGQKAADAIQATGTKFTDVPANHWAEGYIEYLASQNVLGGMGDGTFQPDSNLTATQYAKMLLVALGYDAEIEGFGGSDWSINVQKVANQVGIYDGNDEVVGSAAVTRDEAALYAFNTVKSPLVEYDSKLTVDIKGEGSVTVGNSNAKYKVSNSLSKQTISTKEDLNGGYIAEFAEEYYPGLVYTSEDDGFGRGQNHWEYKGVAIGSYTDTTDLIATYTKKVTKDTLYKLIGSSTVDRFDDDRTAVTYGANAYLFAFLDGVDYEDVTDKDLDTEAGIKQFFVKNDVDGAAGASGNGVLTEVYKWTDAYGNIYVKVVQINTYLVKAPADYNETRDEVSVEQIDFDTKANSAGTAGGKSTIQARFPTAISGEDFDVKDIEKGDYLLVTWSKADDAIGTVDKAELLTGKVTQYPENSNVYVDGEKKEYNNRVGYGTGHE